MGFDTHFGGGNAMNKKLGRLFWPGLWVYFAVMAGFVVAAVLTEQYILAAVLLILLICSICNGNNHHLL